MAIAEQAPVDFRNRPLRVASTVRLRQGVYAGFWARVVGWEGRRVTVDVPAVNDMPGARTTLDSRSMEMSR